MPLYLPCYNEEVVLPSTFSAISELLRQLKKARRIAEESFALYVDDGSKDDTWRLIETAHADDPSSRGLKLAANAGHQNALMAGMLHVREQVDCCITVDADLQDDITVIPQMLAHFAAGAVIVYGVRNDRISDTAFKKLTAHCFYKLMGWLGVNTVPHHADFRLLGRAALDALTEFGEGSLFLRGIFPSMGFKTARVTYARLARSAGETKYPLPRMLSLAFRGISMFSPAPLRLAGLLSLGTLLLTLLESIRALVGYFSGETITGWTSLMIVMLFLGSVQLFCLGIIGEYMANIFTEVKRRPRYIVEKEL